MIFERRFKMTSRRLTNRREALDELASTCSLHLKTLKAVANAYLAPLEQLRVLSQGELIAIFRTLADMRQVINQLNKVIQAASEDDNVANGVAQVAHEFVVAKAALLEVFLPYARNHESALRTLRAALTRPEVARAVDGIAASDERVRGESLETLLDAPLRFASQLRSLLSSLSSLCTPADRGYSALQDGMDLMAAIVREAAASGWNGEGTGAGQAPASRESSPMKPLSMFGAGQGQGQGGDSALALATYNASVMSGADQGARGASGTSAVVSAAMPLVPSSLNADLAGADVSVDAVLAAQADADEAARRLAELERHAALKEQELSMAQKEVHAAEERARAAGRGGPMDSLSTTTSGGGPGSSPMDEALRKLKDEERDLFDRMRNSEHRAVFEAFLSRKQDLENEEARLSKELADHEETLRNVRARLANPPASVLPADPAKASLYIAWKKALAEREELLRAARARKHELLRDLRARHETQVVLLELERRSAVDSLKGAVQAEREKVEAYKKDLAALDESIESARNSMKKFRQEFEQLRVALLIDRMAKSTQIANLADRRARLAKEAESFQEAVEAARQRIAAEETAKWEAKLQAAKEEGERRVADERRAIEAKIDKVRQALAERFEAGFRPLLKEAEQRHVAELQRVLELQKELEAKESELKAAHEAARSVSAASGPGAPGLIMDRHGYALTTSSGGQAPVDPVTGQTVPEWKLREFEDLKSAVASMWEQLDVPAEEVTAFLSEADLMAPFSAEVLEMYQDMYRRLSSAGNGPSAPGLGSGSGYGMQQGGARSPGQQGGGYQSLGPATTPGMSSMPRGGISPLPMSAAKGVTPSSTLGGGSAGRTGAGKATAAGAGGFRNTNIGAPRQDDYYGVKAKPLPPSLGGPGSARAGSPNRR